jgi:hypothetical protein
MAGEPTSAEPETAGLNTSRIRFPTVRAMELADGTITRTYARLGTCHLVRFCLLDLKNRGFHLPEWPSCIHYYTEDSVIFVWLVPILLISDNHL